MKHDQRQAIIDGGIFPELFPLLKYEELICVGLEVSWAILTVTQGGNMKQVMYMVNQGCIPHMIGLLKSIGVCRMKVDTVLNVLKALENVSQVI